jgi:hypothetical protein
MNDSLAPDANVGIHPRLSLFAHAETPPGLFVVAFLYLFLPAIVVLFRFQSWHFGVPVLVAAAAIVYWLTRYLRAAPGTLLWPSWPSWPFLLMAMLAVWMTGTVPPFAENLDWIKHYALFNTLANQSWPPGVVTEHGIGTLRYSLGFYVVPSLVAKYAGMAFLGPAIYAWTTVGMYLVLILAFGARSLPVAHRFILAGVFLLFSGADIIGTGFTQAGLVLPMHFEWWAGFGQLSSNMTSVIWTPQHALAGWIATFLILRYPERAVQAGGAIGAAVAVWSPFCAVGIAPVLGWALFRVGPRHLFSWMNLLAAPVLLIAAAVFLTSSSAGIPATFVWSSSGFWLTRWAMFVMLEFGAIALSLLLLRPRDAGLIGVASATLLLLTLTHVGSFNDLLMRGSLPALGILAVIAATAVVNEANTWRKAPLIVCLVVGLVTPMGEIMRGLVSPRFAAPSNLVMLDVISGLQAGLAPQYVVPGYAGPVTRIQTFSMKDATLMQYGTASFDFAHYRIASATAADAAFVTPTLKLAPGVYEIEIVADWDLTAEAGYGRGAHVSLHGGRLIVPLAITTPKNWIEREQRSVAHNKRVVGYFVSKGEPVSLSFGIGGWAMARGFIEFRQLKLSRIEMK